MGNVIRFIGKISSYRKICPKHAVFGIKLNALTSTIHIYQNKNIKLNVFFRSWTTTIPISMVKSSFDLYWIMLCKWPVFTTLTWFCHDLWPHRSQISFKLQMWFVLVKTFSLIPNMTCFGHFLWSYFACKSNNFDLDLWP